MRKTLSLALVLLVSAGLLIVLAPHAWALETTVNTFDDVVAVDADTSLREAITAAATNGANDVIYLPQGDYQLDGAAGDDANASGDLDIAGETSYWIEIVGLGDGARILGSEEGSGDRVLDHINYDLVLRNLTIEDGGIVDHGAGLRAGTDATIEIYDSSFIDNSAGYTGSDYVLGGAICAGAFFDGLCGTASLHVERTLFQGNSAATIPAQAELYYGGAIASSSELTIIDSAFIDNFVETADAAACGGGVFAIDPDTSITGTTFQGNYVFASFTGEDTIGYGGEGHDLFIGGGNVTNSTFAGVPERGASGSSIYAVFLQEESLLTLEHISVFQTPTGLATGAINGAGSVEVANSFIANSFNDDCSGTNIDSLGYNFDTDGTCDFNTANDLGSANPNVSLLADNNGKGVGSGLDSGVAQTLALNAGSPALDAAEPVGSSGITNDERGVNRPQGIGSDIGAFELQVPQPTQPSGEIAGTGAAQIPDTGGEGELLFYAVAMILAGWFVIRTTYVPAHAFRRPGK